MFRKIGRPNTGYQVIFFWDYVCHGLRERGIHLSPPEWAKRDEKPALSATVALLVRRSFCFAIFCSRTLRLSRNSFIFLPPFFLSDWVFLLSYPYFLSSPPQSCDFSCAPLLLLRVSLLCSFSRKEDMHMPRVHFYTFTLLRQFIEKHITRYTVNFTCNLSVLLLEIGRYPHASCALRYLLSPPAIH